MKIQSEGPISGNSRIRQEHIKLALNAIRQAGHITRVELAEVTGLSKPTVTRVIDKLLTAGLVRQTDFAHSSVGRKALYLELCSGSIYCVGLNFSQRHLYGSIIDITMNICHRGSWSLLEMRDGDAFVALVVGAVETMLNDSGIEREKITGIGVGVPGLVNYDQGVIERLDLKKKLYNIELEKRLAETLGIPLLVDNNANTRVLGEHWYGYGAEHKTSDIIYVIASEGVGAGIISGGQLIRGGNNMAAELGETVLIADGSRYRKLEELCSTYAIEEATGLDFADACHKAEQGNENCRKLFETAANALGVSIFNMLALFDPDVVVMGGSMFDGYAPFYELVIKNLKSFGELVSRARYYLRPSKDVLHEAGVSALIYKKFFNDK